MGEARQLVPEGARAPERAAALHLQPRAGARATGRPCHLAWCVQSEADYLSLAERLPTASRGVEVSVFVTRATADGPPLTLAHGEKLRESSVCRAVAPHSREDIRLNELDCVSL